MKKNQIIYSMKGKEVTAEEEREITVEAEMKAHIEEEIEVTVVMARREAQIKEEMSIQVIKAVVSTIKIQEKTENKGRQSSVSFRKRDATPAVTGMTNDILIEKCYDQVLDLSWEKVI